MFGTISFTKNGQYNISKDHLFSQDENDRLTRRFACRTCRLFKVKCSKNPSTCARCCSLDIDCVYDQPTESRSQHASKEQSRNRSNSMTIQSNPSSTSPTSRPPVVQGSGDRSTSETLVTSLIESEQPEGSNDILAEFTLESPISRSAYSTLSSEQRTTTTTLDLGLSLSGKDISSLDLFFDETNPTDLGVSEWLLALQDSDEIASAQAPNDTRVQQSNFRRNDLDGTLSMSSPSSLLSPQPPSGGCSCLSRLSTALFAVNGMLRRFSCDETIYTTSRFQETLQSVLKVTAQMKGLLDKFLCCAYRCFEKTENRVLLVMIVEHLVDLCSNLVAQVELGFKEPNEVIPVEVHIGGYVVDNHQERQMIFFLLVSERLKALIISAASCKDRLSIVTETDDSQARLGSAIHSLGVLRLKLGNQSKIGRDRG